MRFQLLPSTLNEDGTASQRQHLTCFIVDEKVAFDAGSLAMSAGPRRMELVRDIVLTHAHLDHIAGLPLFIDDLFALVKEPIRIHATRDVIEVLERDIFNWSVYPRFTDLSNQYGRVVQYLPFESDGEFHVEHLSVRAVNVNHKVPTSGFIISDGNSAVGLTGDTAEMGQFWDAVNSEPLLRAVLVECAFPDELQDLAEISHHLTPAKLRLELAKFKCPDCPVYIVNIKPMYRETTIAQIRRMALPGVEILEIGRDYVW